ncbi:MAG: helix-turn-helix domain-containing protein [Planctomycetes bacterium]|nr:helix-turn-helix domain-containing protein [Planctomycetota bacterium]
MAKAKPPRSKTGANGASGTWLSPFDVLTLAEAASYLRLPEDVVRAEAEAGRLVGQNVRGEWRFARGGIVKWLETPHKQSFPLAAVREETQEEYEAFMASVRAHRDQVDRATGHGKYAAE